MRFSALILCTFLLFAAVEIPFAAPPAALHADSLVRAEDYFQMGCAEYSPGYLDAALALSGRADTACKSWTFADPCWNSRLRDSSLLRLTYPDTEANSPKE
jgi:hypothetical protein